MPCLCYTQAKATTQAHRARRTNPIFTQLYVAARCIVGKTMRVRVPPPCTSFQPNCLYTLSFALCLRVLCTSARVSRIPGTCGRWVPHTHHIQHHSYTSPVCACLLCACVCGVKLVWKHTPSTLQPRKRPQQGAGVQCQLHICVESAAPN